MSFFSQKLITIQNRDLELLKIFSALLAQILNESWQLILELHQIALHSLIATEASHRFHKLLLLETLISPFLINDFAIFD